jgi:hypothetical protein
VSNLFQLRRTIWFTIKMYEIKFIIYLN